MTNTTFIEDLVTMLVDGNNIGASRVIDKEIKKARVSGRIVVAKRLNNLQKLVSGKNKLAGQSIFPVRLPNEQDESLFEKVYSSTLLSNVILDDGTRGVILNFLREWESFDELVSKNVFPVNKLIFYGPPGTGKTKLAHALANALDLPLVIIKLDELISSYLGKTGKNIREVFEIAKQERVVILLDEIDTVAKHRDDSKELGELKRVVTVLLQNIDSFPYSSILIGATNHEDLLDKALWRRFGIKLKINYPEHDARVELFKLFLSDFKGNINHRILADVTVGISGSLINDISQSIKRSAIIDREQKVDTTYCLKHVIMMTLASFGNEKMNKKSFYSTAQNLKDSGFPLKKIAEISGIPYTTLRDNIK